MKRLMSHNSYYMYKNIKLQTRYMEVRNCNEELKLKMQDLDKKLKNPQKQFRDEREENEYLGLLINDNINTDIQLIDENKPKSAFMNYLIMMSPKTVLVR